MWKNNWRKLGIIIKIRLLFMYKDHILNWNIYYEKMWTWVSWWFEKYDEHIKNYFDYYDFDKKLKVLDVWCWYWKNSKYILDNKFDLVGIDCWSKPIKCCKDNINWWEFILWDIITYKFEKSFDIIIDAGCFHVIDPRISIKVIKKYYCLLKDWWNLFVRVFCNEEKQFLIDEFLPVWNYSKESFLELVSPYFIVENVIFDENYSKDDKIYYYYLRKK